MAPDDLKTLANDILHANNEAEMHRLLAPLTAGRTEEIAQMVCDEVHGSNGNARRAVRNLS